MNRELITSMEQLGKAIDEGKAIEIRVNRPATHKLSNYVWEVWGDANYGLLQLYGFMKDGNVRVKPEPRVIYVNVYDREGHIQLVGDTNKDFAESHAAPDCLVVAHRIEIPGE